MTYYEKHKNLIHERYLENKDKVKDYNKQYNAEHKEDRKMRSRKHMEAVYEDRGKPPRIYNQKATIRKPKRPPMEYYKPTNPGPINLVSFKF